MFGKKKTPAMGPWIPERRKPEAFEDVLVFDGCHFGRGWINKAGEWSSLDVLIDTDAIVFWARVEIPESYKDREEFK